MEPDDRSALVGSLFALLIVAIIAVRLCLRTYARQRWAASDYFCLAAGAMTVVLVPLTAVQVAWGTTTSEEPGRQGGGQRVGDSDKRARVEAASKVTLASRSIYITYLWLLKGSILSLKKSVIEAFPTRLSFSSVRATWVMLAITYVAAQVATFVECRPISKYWRDTPGSYAHCAFATKQLYALVSLNLFADAVLLALPMPWILRFTRTSRDRRWGLVALFSIHAVILPVEVLRLPLTPERAALHSRLVMAYIEGLLECLIANVPSLYGLVRSRRPSQELMGSVVFGGAGAGRDGSVSGAGAGRETAPPPPPTHEDVEAVQAAQRGEPTLSQKEVKAAKFQSDLEKWLR
ncbi:hypothetical protein KEM52_000558 [Ascosphaera acerosa]|nr:hypothetical protein KEM52_000558 [Ascosphaera acerosa]